MHFWGKVLELLYRTSLCTRYSYIHNRYSYHHSYPDMVSWLEKSVTAEDTTTIVYTGIWWHCEIKKKFTVKWKICGCYGQLLAAYIMSTLTTCLIDCCEINIYLPTPKFSNQSSLINSPCSFMNRSGRKTSGSPQWLGSRWTDHKLMSTTVSCNRYTAVWNSILITVWWKFSFQNDHLISHILIT